MADDRTTQTRGDNANTDQQPSANTGGSSASSGSASPSGRSQNAGTTGDRQRSIQTSSEQSRGTSQQSRGTGMTRGQQTTPSSGYGAIGSPFSLMRRMAEDMDRLFEDFGFDVPGFAFSPALSSQSAQRRGSTNTFQRTGWIPQIETFRRGDKLVLRADLPGMRKEDVSVEIEDGILTISGERSNENEEDREGYYHSERSYGQFQRSLALPDGVTGDNCEATFKDGVLEVTIPMPKQAERAAKKVPIR